MSAVALIPFVSRGLLWKRMKLVVCFLPSAHVVSVTHHEITHSKSIERFLHKPVYLKLISGFLD
jgi:hypothetical protein